MTSDRFKPEVNNEWDSGPRHVNWIVENWLPKPTVGVFSGPGASHLASQLAAAVASEHEHQQSGWLGDDSQLKLKLAEKPVLVASWTCTRVERRARLALWWKATRTDWLQAGAAQRGHTHNTQISTAIGKRYHHVAMGGCGPLWSKDGPSDLSSWLSTKAEEVKAELLVVDPIDATLAASCKYPPVDAMTSYWQRWAHKANCTVIFVSHGHDGSSDWKTSAQWAWNLMPDPEEQTRSSLVRAGLCHGSDYPSEPVCIDLSGPRIRIVAGTV